MKNFLTITILLSAMLVSISYAADDPAPSSEIRRFTVEAATSSIEVDGVLDEKAWLDAVVVDLPFEWFPGDNVRPPVDTECMVTFDDTHFYVAFRAHDPERDAWETLQAFGEDPAAGLGIGRSIAERAR